MFGSTKHGRVGIQNQHTLTKSPLEQFKERMSVLLRSQIIFHCTQNLKLQDSTQTSTVESNHRSGGYRGTECPVSLCSPLSLPITFHILVVLLVSLMFGFWPADRLSAFQETYAVSDNMYNNSCCTHLSNTWQYPCFRNMLPSGGVCSCCLRCPTSWYRSLPQSAGTHGQPWNEQPFQCFLSIL